MIDEHPVSRLKPLGAVDCEPCQRATFSTESLNPQEGLACGDADARSRAALVCHQLRHGVKPAVVMVSWPQPGEVRVQEQELRLQLSA